MTDDLSQEDRDAVREEGGEVAYLKVISRNGAGGLDILFWNTALASFNEMHIDEGVKIPNMMPSKKKR